LNLHSTFYFLPLFGRGVERPRTRI
jgi:hypothetical protein